MNSCFPPLAALSLSDNNNTNHEKTKHRIFWSSSTMNLRKSSYTKEHVVGNSENSRQGLHDLDLYYIREIAHNLKEFDLEQKIDLEIKMREGTTKLLAACKHQTQALEAAKNLLVSNERMSSYMAELQKRKKDSSVRTMGGNGKAKLSLSDLRIPLIWRDIDHFKNKGDYRRFAVFCLVKVGTEMYDTSLLCPVDRSQTDLTFSDMLFFNNVTPEFKLKLEVYSHMLQDDLSIASTPRRIKNTIHTSITRTVGKKLAATLRDEINNRNEGPQFELVASAYMTLDDTNDNIKSYDLKIENTELERNQLPLFGQFCCRLAIQPICISNEVYSGYINILQQTKHKDNYKKTPLKCWTQLQAFKLNIWNNNENNKLLVSIPINKDTIINARRNCTLDIEISNEINNTNESVILRADSLEERAKWFRHLTQHINEHLRWKHAAETVMEIQCTENTRHSYVKATRHGSLYEQTPIIEYDAQTNEYTSSSTTQEAFTLSSTSSICSSTSGNSPPFRQRSASTTTTFKTRTRSAWPFSRNH